LRLLFVDGLFIRGKLFDLYIWLIFEAKHSCYRWLNPSQTRTFLCIIGEISAVFSFITPSCED
jgi:hypothetical protein